MRFTSIVISIVFIYSVFAVAGVVIYGITRDDKIPISKNEKNKDEYTQDELEGYNENDEKKIITNVAVFGTDADGTRTDVIFVASFNSETKDISIVSVPRDTKVTMTEEIINGLISRNRSGFIPSKNGYGVCKINEVHAYAGEGYRAQYSQMMLEDLLGIDIDYYIKFTTSSFRYVVDAIGGVEFEVPMNMDYEDPEQGLYVHLKAGKQHLNGDKAEQLVRYREGYAARDLKRIEVQQEFMKVLFKKVLDTETIYKNIVPLIKTVLGYVETDITIMDALKYVKYIDYISADKITTETIPGTGGTFFNHDKEGTKMLVERIFSVNEDIDGSEDDLKEKEFDTEDKV